MSRHTLEKSLSSIPEAPRIRVGQRYRVGQASSARAGQELTLVTECQRPLGNLESVSGRGESQRYGRTRLQSALMTSISVPEPTIASRRKTAQYRQP